LFNRVQAPGIHCKGSVVQNFSTLKTANNKRRGAYITSVDGTRIFSIVDAVFAFDALHARNSAEFSIEFAPERAPTAKLLSKAIMEHDRPNESDDEHIPTLRASDIRTIAVLRHPDIDFSTVSDDEFVFALMLSLPMTSHLRSKLLVF
jgi:hypothetical protein